MAKYNVSIYLYSQSVIPILVVIKKYNFGLNVGVLGLQQLTNHVSTNRKLYYNILTTIYQFAAT